MDKIYAIIPVNQFANAKTRLSPFLSPEERKNLLKAMLKDIAITGPQAIQGFKKW